MATMLDARDLSPSAEHDAELREADTVTQTRSSSYASQQQRIDDVGPSRVLVVDTGVHTVPSSVPVADVSVYTTPSSVPAAAGAALNIQLPDQLEHRFAEVISAVDALQEEVCKSDLKRKESDKVKDEQRKELGIGRQRDSAADPIPPLYLEDSAALPYDSAAASDIGPQTQHDTVALVSVVLADLVCKWTNQNMDTKRLVIYHGGSWVGNYYEGGLTKLVYIPRYLIYDALVKLVQDVAKLDAARYTIELRSVVCTNSGVARPIIENDNEVSCMMDEDKLVPEVYVTINAKGPIDCVQNGTTVDEDDNLLQLNILQQCNQPTAQPRFDGFLQQLAACGSIPISDPIVCTDETIHDQENSQASDTDKSDDVSIPDIDTNNSDDGLGVGSASAGPLGFPTFGEGSFAEDGLGEDGSGEHPTPQAWTIPGSERYSLEPNLMDESISNDGCLYKGKLFRCKKDLKHTVHMYALN
ncbi:hypothetical protein EZV62_023897 [Acer yangbiense]|uniref:Uncharacterized protein n=1 Tax=Acer yangbiense TaxID=1000413 RepID=A0A5C7H317_9ROSI|nr:hypothetical protein EZV62_023897 [Acer yangbiense]